MNKHFRRTLLRARHLTSEILQATRPEVAAAVDSLVRKAECTRLVETLHDVPEQVRDEVAKLDLDDIAENLFEHVRAKLVDLGIEEFHIQSVLQHAAKVGLGKGIELAETIGAHPDLAQQLSVACVHEIADLAGIDDTLAESVVATVKSPSALDDATLTRLVANGTLTDAQAQRLGFSSSLFQVVDDVELATAVRSASFARLGNQPASSTAELAAITHAEWAEFLVSRQVELPEGATPESAAAALAGRFAVLHPNVALIGRLPQAEEAELTRALAMNDDAAARARLSEIAHTYPGLEIESVLGDATLDARAKAAAIARRTTLAREAAAHIGDTPILNLDLSRASPDVAALGFDRLHASADEQRMVLSMFQTYQRAWAVTKDVAGAHAMVRDGYGSALAAGKQSLEHFRARASLDESKAVAIWAESRSSLADTMLTVGALLDVYTSARSNAGTQATPRLEQIEGIQELLGDLAFCDCQECRSILGPAAYFVDLMKYIEENLLARFAQLPDHPLDLKVRRPDLWTLPLSCENTHDRIPTLDLVNEIFETYITRHKGPNIYSQVLISSARSFGLPFHLPSTRIRAYLDKLEVSHAAIAEAAGGSATLRAQAELGLSADEFTLITTSDPVLAHMNERYGLTFSQTTTGLQVATSTGSQEVDAHVLGTAMGLTRDELGKLVAANFLGAKVTLMVGKRDAASVQNDVEWVRGLSTDALDRMHRFVRLARRIGWSIPELDLAQSTLKDDSLGETSVAAIAALHRLAKRLSSTVKDLCALLAATTQSRQTQLAKSLGISTDELTQLLGFVDLREVAGLTELLTLLEIHDWWKLSGYRLDDVAAVLGQQPAKPFDAAAVAKAALASARTQLSPADAKPSPDLLVNSLAAASKFTSDKLRAIAKLAGVSLTSDALVEALRTNDAAPITTLATGLHPLSIAFSPSIWDAAAIDLVQQNPKWFDDQPLPRAAASGATLSLAQLRALTSYAKIAERDATAVRAVLQSFSTTSSSFPSTSDADMAQALGVASKLVTGLRGQVALPSIAIAALVRLDRVARLTTKLGIDGPSFGSLLSTDYDKLSLAADALSTALVARSTDEKARAAMVDEAERPIREAKRDALANYLIHVIVPRVGGSLDDLYEYFLIDVATAGCATTSKLVAATNSAQLYVHRARMNLETDNLPPNDANHVVVRFESDPSRTDDPAAEWSWRKNFRVWQANRKVFLWPENYLEPDLRDDKTPLFEELEHELLQTDISDQNVLDAYTKYLAGFEELASLSLAGAYHDVIGGSAGVRDILHLFCVSASDPPTFYYRTCENLIASSRDPNTAAVWSAWQKLTVQITGRKVSPVVHEGRLHVFWVDIQSRPVNQVQNGNSVFAGYRHTVRLKFTTLRPDDTWSAPQEVRLPDEGFGFGPARGQVEDLLNPLPSGFKTARLDGSRRSHPEAIDGYTLSGPNWDWAWLHSSQPKSGSGRVLGIHFRNFLYRSNIDLFGRTTEPATSVTIAGRRQVLCARTENLERTLWYGTPVRWHPGLANAYVDDARLSEIRLEVLTSPNHFQEGLYTEKIATIPATATLLAVSGSEEDALLQAGSDLLLLQGSATDDAGYIVHRLGTTLVREIARRLFEQGLDGLLDTHTQEVLAEAGLPITPTGTRIDTKLFNGPVPGRKGKLDFHGPYGVYYREIFFHIPFLIANALNSRARFQAAQRWYHYIYDPTSTETFDVKGLTPSDAAHRLLDRVWRYSEFRGLDLARLKDILSDPKAIAAYQADPFNPWAIARRRVSALQRAILMKYVDNLLDWADSLFTQRTPESINEALMLYVMASDVLGPRPVKLGDCGTGDETITYQKLAPGLDTPEDALVQVETAVLGGRVRKWQPSNGAKSSPVYTTPYTAIVHALDLHPIATANPEPGKVTAKASPAFRGMRKAKVRTSSWGPSLGNSAIRTADKLGGRSFDHASKSDFVAREARFGWSIIRQLKVAFCVPVNADLLGFWDRVEDRLYKIRHCMDINGEVHELALFAPEIDPKQIVAMKAAGLSLEDVLGSSAGKVPPYRFAYLIDRAKAFAASLCGFGSALLSTLEKKDAEQLNRLRLTQQINLNQLTRQVRQLEIHIATDSLAAVERQREVAQCRSDFYAGLIQRDRNEWEIAESTARHAASVLGATGSTVSFVAGILGLIPQVGSPFAMKFGGVEMYNNMTGNVSALSMLTDLANGMAASAGIEGTYTRRRESWRHQQDLADLDVKALDRQIKAAQIRLDIANRSLTLHEKSLEQMQELIELTDGKFTNIGLYTWMSAELQRLYRDAYQNAIALAKLAEQAFRFERSDQTSTGLAASYWGTSAHAGLLAGERLLVDLQTLERRYIETNHRTLELDQAFALSQIDAAALVNLRETGECRFTINEVFFDLFYPGHYKRRIKAVRLTIPCVTGPYVNVGASLRLEGSKIRTSTKEADPPVDVPSNYSVAIATSTAQNDGGMFELSFRDERYMPFEGLGAVESKWHLALPKAFRQFDYQTINDVIVSISYTAEQEGLLRERVERQLTQAESSIVTYFKANPARRLFSLRQDFSSAFTRLLRSPSGTPVTFELSDRNFPLFVRKRTLTVARAVVLLKTKSGTPPSNFQMKVDGTVLEGFTKNLGDLPGQQLPAGFTAKLLGQHTVAIEAAGDLGPDASSGDTSAVDVSELIDILIYLEYTLAENK